MQSEALEKIVNWIAEEYPISSFKDRLQEKLEKYYKKVEVLKTEGRYNITDKDDNTGSIDLEIIDFHNREVYLSLEAEIEKMIRIKIKYDPDKELKL